MAANPRFDIENPAEMDYPEHERTYGGFLAMFKWGTIGVVALLIAMWMGLLAGAGIILSVVTFAAILAIAYFVAR